MNPVQLFRTWKKKDRKVPGSSSIDSGRISKSPSLRNLPIKHFPSDNIDWMDRIPYIRVGRQVQQSYPMVSSLPLDVKSVPPRRPPRPPSLYGHSHSQPSDDTVELCYENLTDGPKRKLPELDGVWEEFLKDANEDPSALQIEARFFQDRSPQMLSRSPNSLQDSNDGHIARLPLDRPGDHAPSLALHTTYISSSDIRGHRKSLDGNDLIEALALFPSPPPVCVESVSETNILYSTPLPSSPNASSYDSTPVATPTTPTLPPMPMFESSSMSSYFHPSCLLPASQLPSTLSATTHDSFSSVSLERIDSAGNTKFLPTSNSNIEYSAIARHGSQDVSPIHWGYAV